MKKILAIIFILFFSQLKIYSQTQTERNREHYKRLQRSNIEINSAQRKSKPGSEFALL